MKSILHLAILCCLGTAYLSAQVAPSPKTKQLGFQLGIQHISTSDAILSPLVYRGSGLQFGFFYSKEKGPNKEGLQFNFANHRLDSRLSNTSDHRLEHLNGLLNYQLQKRIKTGKWKLYLGGEWRNQFAIKFLNLPATNERVWDYFSSINLLASISRPIGKKSTVDWQLSYPILAYVVGRMRHPKDFPPDVLQVFLDDDDAVPAGRLLGSGDFLSINKFVDLVSEFRYRHQLSDRWLFHASYRFQYYQYPKLLAFKTGTSQLLLGLAYQW